jgi:hypothetical protein
VEEHELEESTVNPCGCFPLLKFPYHASQPYPKLEAESNFSSALSGTTNKSSDIEELHNELSSFIETKPSIAKMERRVRN